MIGAGLGLLSGLTGVAALFILVNSVSGLLGHISSLQAIPNFAPLLGVAALAGGVIGSFLGSRSLPVTGVIKALSVVLTIAGFKLVFV